jgi:hypothetical protein
MQMDLGIQLPVSLVLARFPSLELRMKATAWGLL